MNARRWFAGLVSLAALAGCGSATDAVTFKAPAGFTSAFSVGPFMQLWTGPQDSALMLMALPKKVDLNQAINSSSVRDAQIEKQAAVKICGNQPALYISMIGTSHTTIGSPAPAAHKSQIDMIATEVNDKTYMAMYMRPVGAPADAAAETAIHDVCPK
jgi:hypothetical protein